MKTYQITYKSAKREFRIKIPAEDELEARDKLIRFVCPQISDIREIVTQEKKPVHEQVKNNVPYIFKDIFDL